MVMAAAIAMEALMAAVAADVPVAGRVALVAGATGLVGQAVLAALLTDKHYATVHSVGRRPPAVQHPKLIHHTVDFGLLPALPAVDDVYIALGTTISVAGSQQAFRSIDFDAVVAVALSAKESGATKLGVVSAMGANAKSGVFYNRVKGEMEEALAKVGFQVLVIARPSMLAGNRDALHQPSRLREKLGLAAMSALGPLIPANYKAIDVDKVSKALIHGVKSAPPGIHVLLSGTMQMA